MPRRRRRRKPAQLAGRPLQVEQRTEIQGNPLTDQPRTVSRVTTEADITRDYVASSFLGYMPILQALPHAFDDITCDFGVDVYERMSYDAEVSANLDVMTLASTAGTERVVAGVSPEHKDHDKAVFVANFFQWMFDRMKTPLTVVRKSMSDQGLTFGSSVAELTFDMVQSGEYEGSLIVTHIHPTCIRETAFVVDGYDHVIGIIPAKMPHLTLPIGGMVPLPVYATGQDKERVLNGVVPRSKFLVMTWLPTCGDPRGQSALRPAYTAWWAKQQIVNEMMSWFSKFAQPSIWATTAPDAIASCYIDPETGMEVQKEPTEILLQALTQFKNASVMALPNGSTVNAIEVSQGGHIFLDAIGWANTEITRGILKQHLATNEGIHQARAAAEVHQNVLSLIILNVKNWQAQAIRRDILRPLTIANFGESWAHLTPKLDLGDGDGFPITATEVASLQSVGWFEREQMATLDKLLGLPVRETDRQDDDLFDELARILGAVPADEAQNIVNEVKNKIDLPM